MKADELLPGHEKKPAQPIPEPTTGTKYHVHTHDTWETVAAKHDVTVEELITHNCGAHVSPQEINWYLHKRVGCNETYDQKSWAFSDGANPGFLYIPVIPNATQNPRINTLYRGPKNLGCGGMAWMVEFELPNKPRKDGWIIQQINRSYDIRKADGSIASPTLNAPKVTFWEAWPVKKGSINTADRFDLTDEGVTYDDSFDQPKRPDTKGVFKVSAVAKFFEGPLPKTFVKQNPATKAEDRLSTTTKPDFWDGTGTGRTLTVTWDCTYADAETIRPTSIITLVYDKRK